MYSSKYLVCIILSFICSSYIQYHISAFLLDGNQPEIQNVFRGNNMNELIVLWTSNNSDIVNVSITLESNGQNMTPNTDWYKKGASITVDDNKSPYTVKVMEQSKCGQNFYSGGYQYKYEEPDTASGTSGGKTIIVDNNNY